MAFIREDMADIRVTVDGTPYGGSWHSVEGASLEADDAKVRAGGMGSEFSLGGPVSRDDATVSIPLDDVVLGWHPTLEVLVGEDAPVTVTYQFLNRKKEKVGKPFSITGTLKSAKLPDMAADSGDAAMYEIIVSCDEIAASGS